MDSSLKYSDDLYVTTTVSSKEVEVGAAKITVNADLIYEQL